MVSLKFLRSEIKRLEATIEKIRVPRKGDGRPRQNSVRIIADKGYDSDPLRQRRLKGGIELICLGGKNNQTKKDKDGRKLRPDRRRWKVEPSLAWRPNLRTTGCWLGKRNSDLASFLSPCLHPDCIEAVLKWLLRFSDLFNVSYCICRIKYRIDSNFRITIFLVSV